MDLSALKEIIILTLFLVVLICVLIPLLLAQNAQRSGIDIFHSERYSKIVSILNCFAAGIFLATCLLHLFPDVRQNVTAAVAAIDPDQKFPFPEFTIAMGFFLLLTIEQIMSDIRHRRLKPPSWLPQVPSSTTTNAVIVVVQPSSVTAETDNDDDRSGLLIIDHHNEDEPAAPVPPPNQVIQNHMENDNNCVIPTTSSQSYQEEAENYHSMRIVAMIIALSVHSTFEGIAIGVQSTQDDVLQITGALAIHKVVIAFSLGLALVQSPMGALKSVLCGLLFAVTSPLGIAIGLGVTLYEGDLCGSLIVGSLQGMAAGTFLYVTFLDVLPHEFKSGGFRLPKLLSFIVGFSVIVGALFLFPDS